MARETFSLLTWLQRLFLLSFTAVLLAVSVFLWSKGQEDTRKNASAVFEGQVDKLALSVAERARLYQVMMQGAASFWESNPHASRQDWANYLNRLQPWENFPGLSAISYAQPVLPADLESFVAEAQKTISPDFAIKSHPQKAETEHPSDQPHMIITQMEPHAPNRSILLGLDLSENEGRRLTAEKARDSGNVSLSPALRLVTAENTSADFLMMAPVYKALYPTTTTEERQIASQGWVFAGLHGSGFAAALLGESWAQGYDIHLTAPNQTGENVPLLSSMDDHHTPLMSSQRSLFIAGQTWSLTVHSTPRLENILYGDPWSPLVVHILAALALAGGAYFLFVSRQQSRLLALQTLQQLGERERHYQSVIEGTIEGYWQIDPITRQTVAVNSSLCHMLGYERSELLGQPPTRFCHPDFEDEFSTQISKLWERDHRVYDITLLRKNGSLLFAHVSASTLRDHEGAIDTVFAMITDMTDATVLRNRLTEKTKALEASNSDLQQFAYVASHDLQAPLRNVSSYLQLLERRYSPQLNDEAREFIQFAVQGARRMSRLINDLLTFSRVETTGGGMTATELLPCMRQAVTNLELTIEAKNAHIELPMAVPLVLGDSSQLISLFQNLIGNALKYCPDERAPHVVISATMNEQNVEIHVADNGIGIPPDQYARIFLIFQRLHGPEEYEGTGIGLSLVKRILERHNGRIWVSPNHAADGTVEGTVFHVSLPVPSKLDAEDNRGEIFH